MVVGDGQTVLMTELPADPRLQVDLKERVATLTLADPSRRNALDPSLADALAQALAQASEAADVAVVVVTGAPPAFCAGAALAELQAIAGLAADEPGQQERLRRLRRLYAPFLALRACPKPTLALVDGAAVGAGLNLALAADVVLATPRSLFMTGFDRLGLHPGGGCSAMLSARVGPQRAAAALLFGQPFDGRQAADSGLAFACVPEAELAARGRALAREVASGVDPMMRATKATLRLSDPPELEAIVEHELFAQAASTLWSETRQRLAAAAARVAAKARGETL